MSLPQHMRADDPANADPARRRLLQKSSFPRFPSFPSRPSKTTLDSHPLPSPTCPTDDILINDANLPLPEHDKDVYRWAVLYENQRGITLFSTPFYSPLSLFPFDPQPFTIPNTSPTSHPNISLDNYPLPDGTWRWVSTAWMIDMRTDRGEVQHDGFEYNWSFRDSNWHAKVGKLGAGTWVRRRRWVRLMMRPAIHSHAHTRDNNRTTTPSRSLSSHSLLHPPSKLSLAETNHASHVWDGSERDWQYIHHLLRLLGRDGRKLELWRLWLAPYAHASDIRGKGKLSDAPQAVLERHLSDIVPERNPPPLTHLVTVLRNHGETILHSFVFPDSRARFVDLARQAGLAEDLESGLGHAVSAADVDFWSYADSLDKLVNRSDTDRCI